MSVRSVAIRAGAVVPVPIDDEAAGALERVEIVRALGERGSFRLQFRLEHGSSLPDRFLSESGDLVRIVISTGDEVAMDGVLVEHCLSFAEEKGRVALTLAGEDLTLLMDLIDVSGRQFAAVPAPARVQIILAAYAPVGVIPSVVPPRVPDVPGPTDIAHQNGSDYAYVRSLAEQAGYRFTLESRTGPRQLDRLLGARASRWRSASVARHRRRRRGDGSRPRASVRCCAARRARDAPSCTRRRERRFRFPRLPSRR